MIVAIALNQMAAKLQYNLTPKIYSSIQYLKYNRLRMLYFIFVDQFSYTIFLGLYNSNELLICGTAGFFCW